MRSKLLFISDVYSQILTNIQLFKVRILRNFSDGLKIFNTQAIFCVKMFINFFLQGVVIGSRHRLLIAGV